MKGHKQRVNSKRLSCSFHSDIFPNVSYHWLKEWKSILESKTLVSMSNYLFRVPEHLQKPSTLALRGVTMQYEMLMLLLRKRNSYLPHNNLGSSVYSVRVTDRVNVPPVFLEAGHFFGVTLSCTSWGRRVRGYAGCSRWGLLSRGFPLHLWAIKAVSIWIKVPSKINFINYC